MPWLANAIYYMLILAVKRSGFWFLKLASERPDESKHTLKFFASIISTRQNACLMCA